MRQCEVIHLRRDTHEGPDVFTPVGRVRNRRELENAWARFSLGASVMHRFILFPVAR